MHAIGWFCVLFIRKYHLSLVKRTELGSVSSKYNFPMIKCNAQLEWIYVLNMKLAIWCWLVYQGRLKMKCLTIMEIPIRKRKRSPDRLIVMIINPTWKDRLYIEKEPWSALTINIRRHMASTNPYPTNFILGIISIFILYFLHFLHFLNTLMTQVFWTKYDDLLNYIVIIRLLITWRLRRSQRIDSHIDL